MLLCTCSLQSRQVSSLPSSVMKAILQACSKCMSSEHETIICRPAGAVTPGALVLCPNVALCDQVRICQLDKQAATIATLKLPAMLACPKSQRHMLLHISPVKALTADDPGA